MMPLYRVAVAHREDCQHLALESVNWEASLKYHRALSAHPRLRTALEVVLSGGMLTARRLNKRRGRKLQMCPHGCNVPDSPHHRYWICGHWEPQRRAWKLPPVPPLMQDLGLVPASSELGSDEIRRVQAYMCTIVLESAEQHRQNIAPAGEEEMSAYATCAVGPPSGDVGHLALHGLQPRPRLLDDCDLTSGSSNSGGGKFLRVVTRRKRTLQAERERLASNPEVAVPRLKPRRVMRNEVKLPPHITMSGRSILGSGSVLRILTCQLCGGQGKDVNRGRFVGVHMGCVAGFTHRRRKRTLTRQERLDISEKSGTDFVKASQAKRRRLVDVLVHSA